MNSKHDGFSDLPPEIVLGRLKRFYMKLVYRAICDYVNYKGSSATKYAKIYESAREWIYDEVTTEVWDKALEADLRACDDTASFDSVCSILGWDPDWIRSAIQRLKKSDLERIGRNGLI